MPSSANSRGTRLIAMGLLLVIGYLLHVGIGSYLWLSPWQVVQEIARGRIDTDATNNVVWSLRLPRATGCALIGASLAAVGSAFQALFRNPLAEPYVVGVSSGAAVGGTVALLLGFAGFAAGLGVMAFAFAGGMGALLLVLGLSRRGATIHVHTLLLAGVVIGSMLSAVMTVLLLMAGEDTNQVLRWLLGSTANLFWNRIAVLAIVFVAGLAVLVRLSRHLNVLSVSELQARSLGIDSDRLKWTVLVVGTAMAAVTVGAAGIIGFLGLVAPHIARRTLGSDLRWSLIGSAIVGAGLLLFADLLAQRVVAVTELPVGAVTAVLGAPTLILLLRREPRTVR